MDGGAHEVAAPSAIVRSFGKAKETIVLRAETEDVVATGEVVRTFAVVE